MKANIQPLNRGNIPYLVQWFQDAEADNPNLDKAFELLHNEGFTYEEIREAFTEWLRS